MGPFKQFCSSWSKTIGAFIGTALIVINQAVAQNVLLIQSYHAEYPWDASYIEGIKQQFSAGINLTTFEMDTKRLPTSEFEAQANKAWAEYEKQKPDLVMLGDDNALKFLSPKFAKTNTPVVYLGINNNPRSYGITNQANFTGVLERPLIKRSMQLMSDILPMKKVLALFDNSKTSNVVKSEIFRNKDLLKVAGVEVDLKLVGDMNTIDSMLATEKASKTYDAIFIGLYSTINDADGNRIPANTVLNSIADKSPVPVFAFWDFSIGKGKAAGGYVLFGKEQGIVAAELAEVMLNKGESTVVPPKLAKKGRYLFSQVQLNKWGITLPKKVQAKATMID